MAIILDGKALAIERRNLVKEETKRLIDLTGQTPHLVVILVGDNPASQSYVRGKEKACINAGIKSTIIQKPDNISQEELVDLIHSLNHDESVDGILLQLPIPKHLDSDYIMNLISPKKDVDGFTEVNVAKLTNGTPNLVPCTPLGIMRLLEKYQIEIQGKHCVIIGRSQIVGKPMASLLIQANGTVTVCHSKTTNLPEMAKLADILVVAIGRPLFVDKTFVKDGAVVIDVGINRVDGKIVGDVDFESVVDHCSYITPVPGGVGPMTIACLLENTLTCFKNRTGVK